MFHKLAKRLLLTLSHLDMLPLRPAYSVVS
jgi:hypothetical protein